MITTTLAAQDYNQDRFVQQCLTLAKSHYENFPVASFLLPRHLRAPIAVIYAFARSADDFADEGDRSNEERLGLLNAYVRTLEEIEQGQTVNDPLFLALYQIIKQFKLPFDPFYRLLTAFKQDVVKKRYSTFEDIMDYCHNSADPVGYLLICLYGRLTDENTHRSNQVCSALQIINFLQDISVDWQKGRVYLPQDEMRQAGIDEGYLDKEIFDLKWRDFFSAQLTRAENMIKEGSVLCAKLPISARIELRMTVEGGLCIIRKLRKQNRHQFIKRPRLTPWDWFIMATRALFLSYR